MTKPGKNLFLTLDAPSKVAGVRAVPDEFKGYPALQFPIARQIHITHPAATDERENFVISDCFVYFGHALAEKSFRHQANRWLFDEAVARARDGSTRLRFLPASRDRIGKLHQGTPASRQGHVRPRL